MANTKHNTAAINIRGVSKAFRQRCNDRARLEEKDTRVWIIETLKKALAEEPTCASIVVPPAAAAGKQASV